MTHYQFSVHAAGNLAPPEGSPATVTLESDMFSDVRTLGAALRNRGVLPKGTAIKSAVQQGHDWFVYPRSWSERRRVYLKRTDLWAVIGRGQAGWHASRAGVSSSGGTLDSVEYPASEANGFKGSRRAGYLAEAAEGARVYDASQADPEAYVRFVVGGPMLSVGLADDAVDSFGREDSDAARRMLPGLSGGFEVMAGRAIVEQAAGRKYGSLDKVGWTVYRSLLEQVPGVRFGVVRSGRVVWE